MASIEIEYKDQIFEENPTLVTWIQLFLVKFLSEDSDRPRWSEKLIEEWKQNIEIEIYKYVFDEELLDSKEKEIWAVNFLKRALDKADQFSLAQFSSYIEQPIKPTVDYDRIKSILTRTSTLITTSIKS